MMGELMQLAYNLADTFWLGRLGTEELAAISFSFPIIFIVISVAGGFSLSGSALVSQHTGAKQGREASHAAGQVLMFGLTLSVGLALMGLAFGKRGLAMMNPEPEVLKLAWIYFRILCAGFPFTFVYFIFQAVYRAVGDTVTPMLIKVATVTINIVLDPILIFGVGPFPHMGIAGAATATIFSRFLATFVGLVLLFTARRGGLHLRLSDLVPNWRVIKQVIKIGAPGAASMSALALARTLMTGIVGSFGTATVAAWGVVNRLMSVFRLPAMGTSRATTILVGQHLGADQIPDAEESAWTSTKVTFGVLIVVAAVAMLAAPVLVAIFDSTPEVVRIGTEYFRIAVFGYTFLAVQQVLCGGLRGAGNTMEDAGIRIVTQWGIQIPAAYYLSSLMASSGVWWSVFLSRLFGAVLSIFWFRRGTWKQKVIEDEPAPVHDD